MPLDQGRAGSGVGAAASFRVAHAPPHALLPLTQPMLPGCAPWGGWSQGCTLDSKPQPQPAAQPWFHLPHGVQQSAGDRG